LAAGEFGQRHQVFNFGGSSALRLQIENGSPANVFLAADKKSVNTLLSKNLVDGKSVVDLLSNRLVIVAAAKDRILHPVEEASQDRKKQY
jgi:molybdate transport system substrate-binding protein